MNLEEFFNKAISKGYEVRITGKNGQKGWQEIEHDYLYDGNKYILSEKYLQILNSLKILHSNDDKEMRKVRINITNDIIISNLIETEHFLIQLFRIPLLNNCYIPLVKLIQIGYNIGQLKASIELGAYSQEIVNFIKSNDLDILSTYINEY